MNKKGSTLLIILFAVIYFFAGMILYQFLKSDIDIARSSLSCSATSTSGDRLVCLIVGSVIPLVLWAVISATGGILTDKLT